MHLIEISQIEYLIDGMLPDDFSGALVFSNTVIDELKNTIKEHGSETCALKRLQKELRKEHTSLVRERKSRENKIEELNQRVIDVQRLKFGQVFSSGSFNTNTNSESTFLFNRSFCINACQKLCISLKKILFLPFHELSLGCFCTLMHLCI